MAKGSAKAAKTKRAAQSVDPRFAALTRLLARDLAKKHLEQDSRDNELSRSPDSGYDSDSLPEDAS